MGGGNEVMLCESLRPGLPINPNPNPTPPNLGVTVLNYTAAERMGKEEKDVTTLKEK